MSHGDEWKKGTPYEGDAERAHRELGEALGRSADAMRDFAASIDGAGRSYLYNAVVLFAAARLVEAGMPGEDAKREAYECAMLAAAEGLNVSGALGRLVQRHTNR